jgi:hypothetical protein
MLPKKGQRLPLLCCFELITCSENVGPTLHVAVKAQHTPIFWLWRVTSDSVLDYYCFNNLLYWVIPTQMEPIFISKKCMFSVKNTITYCLPKPVTKMQSSYNHLLHFLELVCFYAAVDLTYWSHSILLSSKPVPVELIMSVICKVNVPIWLLFCQAVPQLEHHSI